MNCGGCGSSEFSVERFEFPGISQHVYLCEKCSKPILIGIQALLKDTVIGPPRKTLGYD